MAGDVMATPKKTGSKLKPKPKSGFTITARDAKSLMPGANADPEEALAKIQAEIIIAAQRGNPGINVHNLVPKNHGIDWMMGKKTPYINAIEKVLKSCGFEINTSSGGHAGPGHVYVNWK